MFDDSYRWPLWTEPLSTFKPCWPSLNQLKAIINTHIHHSNSLTTITNRWPSFQIILQLISCMNHLYFTINFTISNHHRPSPPVIPPVMTPVTAWPRWVSSSNVTITFNVSNTPLGRGSASDLRGRFGSAKVESNEQDLPGWDEDVVITFK